MPETIVPLIIADIYELAGSLRQNGETIAAAVGQTQARWQVMSAASGGRYTVPQIARRLGVSRQNVQRIADLLVEDGSATFDDNPDHRGSPYLTLSKAGTATLAKLSKAAAGYHATLADKMSAAEIAALHRGLRKLIAAVNSN
ncbi:MAG: helix-turn-helix domain-containing protein [Pseudolabrys sp.]|nr:helix-turn-helix domain-containing protein [Pseudolabrys sp.]